MTPPPVQPFYDAARNYVKRAVGVDLDDSEESLAYVDHYIASTARAESLKPEVLALVAPALGAYFGQVAIARFGGKWVIEGDDPADWHVELAPAPLSFHPVGMAAEALRGEEVEGYDAVVHHARRSHGSARSRRSNRRRPSTRATTTR